MSGYRHAWTAADSEVYEQVGYRLWAARQRASMTQQQLADLVGLTRSSVANIERGNQGIGIPLFLSLCDALNVSSAVILDGGS